MVKKTTYRARKLKSGKVKVNRTTRKPGIVHKVIDKFTGRK